jgi:hypothetical protein
MELDKWNRWPVISPSDSETVCYTTRHITKTLAEAPPWQIIEKYWNTSMQQNDIWSIALEAGTK